ncbi:serine/threonine protein kinase PknJ [Nocardia sp. JMUB6875]|uniref:serine/threonine-protein kinase n=1 Tax=Nocardia sp. JMUB6875 TaxID=3158170 RepID=UPI0032E6AF39
MTDLKPGEDIAGYVIERWIGAGGSGTVYAARHPRLPRLAALKVFNREEVNADAEGWRRFEREADITARFDHPNIVTVYDRGLDEGRLWIAMQYVDGPDADGRAGLSPERALRIGRGIASALDYAHGKGVLHRDVKPSNIMLSPAEDGRPERALLTDFGIARLRDETTHVTKTGDISATFAYASPEQVSGRFLDPRTDQYSLACTLFVLLTGSRPFLATDLAGLIYAHTSTPPLHVSQVRPDLSPGFDAVFDRALAKHPSERFDCCTDFIDAAYDAWRMAGTTTSVRTRVTGSRTDPTAIGPGHYAVDDSVPGYRAFYGGAGVPVDDAVPHRHRAPEPVYAGSGTGRGIIIGLSVVLAAAVIGGSAIWAVAELESHGTPSGAPLSAAIPTMGSVAPTTTVAATTPLPAGRVPAEFVGEWSGSSDSNANDYRLSIRQGELNQALVTSTISSGGRVICVFDYRLLGVPGTGDITLGAGTLSSGGSGCQVQGTHELVLSNGVITRALSVSGFVTYRKIG